MCMSTPKGIIIIIIITAFNRNFVFTAGRREKSLFFYHNKCIYVSRQGLL